MARTGTSLPPYEPQEHREHMVSIKENQDHREHRGVVRKSFPCKGFSRLIEIYIPIHDLT